LKRRTNRSGIIFKAGPIGGINQEGKYKIDVRFNKSELSKRITQIASKAEQITISNFDALDILNNIENYTFGNENFLIYMEKSNKGFQLKSTEEP
jgi:DNA adenine methylase